MTTKFFILACIFPTPVIFYVCIRGLLQKKKGKPNNFNIAIEMAVIGNMGEDCIKVKSSEGIIEHILLKHYKCIHFCGMKFTWLEIHKLYRILIVVCSVYLSESVPRILAMTGVLLVITIGNIFLKPYKDKRANKTATLSYIANLCIAIVNLWKATLVTFDFETNYSLRNILLSYFNVFEKCLLN